MPRKESNTGPISAQAQQDLVSEGIENFELPKSLVAKIAKSAVRFVSSLPSHSCIDFKLRFTDSGECKVAERDRIVSCKGFDRIYQLSR